MRYRDLLLTAAFIGGLFFAQRLPSVDWSNVWLYEVKPFVEWDWRPGAKAVGEGWIVTAACNVPHSSVLAGISVADSR